MSSVIRRSLYSLAVLFWSGVLLYFYASGRINAYLAPDFRLMVFLGGLGLGVVGLFNLLTAGNQESCGHDHGGEDHDHHEAGDMNSWVAFAIMVAPLALAVFWTKDAYSGSALSRKGLHDNPAETYSPIFAASMPPLTREMIEQGHGKTADGFYEFSLMELFLATGDRELQTVIDGMKVQTTGRWIGEKGGNATGTRKRLYRLFMTCCAADSRAIPIILEFGKTAPDFPENGWVSVTGTMRYLLEDGLLQPVLQVERVEAAEAPSEESFMRK